MEFIQYVGPSFTLNIPSTWTVIASSEFQTLLVSPLMDNEKRANFTVLLNAREDNISLIDYAERITRDQQKLYPNFEEITDRELVTSENIAGIYRTLKWAKPITAECVFQHQAFFMDQDLIYILTGSRPCDTPSNIVDQLDNLYQTIIESFGFEEVRMDQSYFD